MAVPGALWLLEEGQEKVTIKGPILSRKTIFAIGASGAAGKNSINSNETRTEMAPPT